MIEKAEDSFENHLNFVLEPSVLSFVGHEALQTYD